MTTITILKEITKKSELVAIPKKEYEELLRLRKAIPIFKPTVAQKKDLEQARREYKKGEYITLSQLERELGTTSKRKS